MFDERFYTMVKSLPDVVSLVGNRVYHVEVVQATGEPFSKYPAVVYQLAADEAVDALAGKSGLRRAVFSLMLFSRSTADVRRLSRAVTTIDQSVAAAAANGFEWLKVQDVSDEYVIPFEYDEKAMKYAAAEVLVIYREE